jgi:predicted dehydrogenase
LITHRFPIERALEAYELILEGKERIIGVILDYPEHVAGEKTVRLRAASPRSKPSNGTKKIQDGKDLSPIPVVGIGVIGAGLYANGTILPALKGIKGVRMVGVAANSGLSAEHFARKAGFEYSTTEVGQITSDPDIDLVMVLTRHGSHAGLVCEVLKSGKHVFVEKPLAINNDQLSSVKEMYFSAPGQLMVGFNRRFASVLKKALIHTRELQAPLTVNIRVNVGYIAPDIWIYDPIEGGGNIVGEVCHFFDLIQAITQSQTNRVNTQSISLLNGDAQSEDNVVITLEMVDGSIGTITYTTLGDRAQSRELVEVFGSGAVCVIDNFKTLRFVQNGNARRFGGVLSGVDRGHKAELEVLFKCLHDGVPFPVSFEDYLSTTRTSLAAVESLRSQIHIDLK